MDFFLEPMEIIISLHFLVILLFVAIEGTIFVSFAVSFGVADYINIGPIDIFERSLVRISSYTLGSVNSNDFASVTWLNIIDEILVGAHMNGLWSLTFWDSLRCFLHLDVLFVREHTPVVNHLKSASTPAIVAEVWLSDLTSLDVSEFLLLTFGALEIGFFHLWDSVGGSDDNTFKGDKLVNLTWVELTNLEDLPHVEWSNLNNLVVILVHIILAKTVESILVACIVFDILVINPSSNQIENWNDIGWIVFQLFVELLVKSVHVVAVNI